MRLAYYLVVSALCGGAASQAAEYTNSEKGYALEFESYWTRVSYPTPVDVALQCDPTVCGEDVRFTSNANFVPQAAALSTADFLSSAPAELLTETVRQIVASFGTVQVLSAPKMEAIGDRQGYVGSYRLEYNDGRRRALLYALTFDHGYLYHLQFYEPADVATQNTGRFYALINGFRVRP
jgi:hypothetical protein